MKKDFSKIKCLIVKTSSTGDIIQAFGVLDYLSEKFKDVEIDWIVEKPSLSLVNSHPLVKESIRYDIKIWKKNLLKKNSWISFFKFVKFLRRKNYDIVFDLQGNCKSGLATLLSKGKVKVGFGYKTVREWPNILSTNIRYDVPNNINMRLQYIQLLQFYYKDIEPFYIKGGRLNINNRAKSFLNNLLCHPILNTKIKVMICSGSKWPNKQLSFNTLCSFMKLIKEKLDASFLLIWGNELEKALCQKINKKFIDSSVVIDKMPLPMWQNLMNDVDLVIAIDSSSLHLCGTISTPSFSVFGPTNPQLFKPLGKNHFAIRGKCPYGHVFQKQCPLLRSCSTGSCIHDLQPEDIFESFYNWWNQLTLNKKINNNLVLIK